MLTVGRFVEAVASVIDRDGPRLCGVRIADLHTHGALENVANDGAGVTVGLRRFSGAIVDSNDLKVEIVAFERGKALGDDGVDARGRLVWWGLSLLRGWCGGRQRCVTDDGENIGPAFRESHRRTPFLSCAWVWSRKHC